MKKMVVYEGVGSEFDKAVLRVKQQLKDDKEALEQKFLKLESTIETAKQLMKEVTKVRAHKSRREFVDPFGSTDKQMRQTLSLNSEGSENLQHLKLNFPKFDEGKAVEDWVQDCNHYFKMFRVNERKKVTIAGMHLEGTASSWYHIYSLNNSLCDWSNFTEQITQRFGLMDQELLMENFNQLKQVDSLEQYYNEFEGYVVQLREKIPSLTDAYFLESFIGGMQKEIQQDIRILTPKTREAAYQTARYLEQIRSGNEKENQQVTKAPDKEKQIVAKGNLLQLKSSDKNEEILKEDTPGEVVLDTEELLSGEDVNSQPMKEMVANCNQLMSNYEICTNVSSMELAGSVYIQDLQQGKGNDNLKSEMTIQLEELSSIIPTSRKVQNKPSKGVYNQFKDMNRSKVKLEVPVKVSVGNQLRYRLDTSLDFLVMEKLLLEPSQLQWKVYIFEIGNADRLQSQGQNSQQEGDYGFGNIISESHQKKVDYGRTGIVLPYKCQNMVLENGRLEMHKSRGPEYHGLSNSVAICIFDPGGRLSCFHGVLVAVLVGILLVQYMLLETLLQSLSKLPAKATEQRKEPFQLHKEVFDTKLYNLAGVQSQNVQGSAGADMILIENNQQYDPVRDGMIVQLMRTEVIEAWRRKYTITIFDPGGQKGGIIIYISGVGKINHEDMVIFKGEGLSGNG